jgi:FkbM family methyltransferase
MTKPPAFDPRRRPGRLDTLAFQARKAKLLWQWRNYAKADHAFINRLLVAGIGLETLWDVGASNGAWSWIVGRQVPSLSHHLFEPLAGHVASYADTLSHHLAAFPAWTLHSVALGANDQEADIFVDGNTFGSSLIESDYVRQNCRTVTVPVRAGDSLIQAGEAPIPDLLKADTQGFELELLKGSEKNLPSVKGLLLETWLSRGYGPSKPLLVEIIQWLGERGFVPVEFGDGYRDKSGSMRSVDAFFLRKDMAAKAGFSV